MNRGLLLTVTEPPPAMEEEFNAWYDEEHLAERLAIPGFRSVQRWVADVPRGAGKYLATYELDSPAVLSSAAYLERFENPTPWSKRCLCKTVVLKRWLCEQQDPGMADPYPGAAALVMNSAVSKPLQVRRFTAQTGEVITLSELSGNGIDTASGPVYRLYQS
jgi:hypothetical protein